MLPDWLTGAVLWFSVGLNKISLKNQYDIVVSLKTGDLLTIYLVDGPVFSLRNPERSITFPKGTAHVGLPSQASHWYTTSIYNYSPITGTFCLVLVCAMVIGKSCRHAARRTPHGGMRKKILFFFFNRYNPIPAFFHLKMNLIALIHKTIQED